jgi:hypothetical protein
MCIEGYDGGWRGKWEVMSGLLWVPEVSKRWIGRLDSSGDSTMTHPFVSRMMILSIRVMAPVV